jgi:hypothetical protein
MHCRSRGKRPIAKAAVWASVLISLTSFFYFANLALALHASAAAASPDRAAEIHSRQESSSPDEKPKDKPAPVIVRWAESQPGCTFSRGEEGKYSYGLWSGDVGVIMAVEARELQLVRHRIEPILGVLLTVRYRGTAALEERPDGINLQFLKHFKVMQSALDPESYSQKIQADADAFDDETRRAIAKHPEEKQERELRLQEYQKSVNELIEFLRSDSLRGAHLDHATPEVHGWVFFNTDTKWLGNWKSQEEFVLRFPLGREVYEFPFTLPPEPGEFLLRKRP